MPVSLRVRESTAPPACAALDVALSTDPTRPTRSRAQVFPLQVDVIRIMLIRMTKTIQTRLAIAAGIVLALFAGSAIASPEDNTSKVAIVVAGAAATDKAALTQAHAVADATDADLKVVKTNAEQLGVIHMLAARGYDTVVTVGVDRRTAHRAGRGEVPAHPLRRRQGQWPRRGDERRGGAPTAYL